MGPKIRAHTNAVAFKNTIIKYWPHSIVNGQDTFGSLTTWTPAGIVQDNAHRRIYHVLGMKIKNIPVQDPGQIDATYMYLKAYNAPNGAIDETDIRNYISDYSPLIYPTHANVFNPDPTSTVDMNIDPYKNTVNARWDNNGWMTTILVYCPTTIDLVDNSITDQQIIQKVHDISYKDIFYDQYTCSRLTALAMLDTGNTVFETRVRIIEKTIVLKDQFLSAKNIGRHGGIAAEQIRYVKQAQIEFSFRRIADVHVGLTLPTAITEYFLVIDTKVESLIPVSSIAHAFGLRGISDKTGLFASKTSLSDMSRSLNASVNQQLCTMANWANPYPNDHILISTDPTLVNSYYADSQETQVKISGLIDLPPVKFKKEFLSLVTSGFSVHKKKGHWYDVVVSAIIAIVAIALAAIAIVAQQYWLAAVILSAAAMAEGLWGMYLAKNGGSPGSIHETMGISNALGIAAMIVGIATIYQSWVNQLEKQAFTDAAAQELQESIESDEAAGLTINSEATTIAAQNFSAAYVESSATSIVSILSDAVSSAVAVGGKLGILGDNATKYAGFAVGSVDGITTAFSSATTTTLDSIENSIINGVKNFVSKPLSEILNQVVNWMNTVFNVYMSIVAPPNEGLADKQAALDKISKEVETTNPENMENTWLMYTDPYGSIFEVGDIFDKTVPMLTNLSISGMMNKCYYSYK
jgi:hypothetical protein